MMRARYLAKQKKDPKQANTMLRLWAAGWWTAAAGTSTAMGATTGTGATSASDSARKRY